MKLDLHDEPHRCFGPRMAQHVTPRHQLARSATGPRAARVRNVRCHLSHGSWRQTTEFADELQVLRLATSLQIAEKKKKQ